MKYDHQEAIRLFATGQHSFADLGRRFNVDRTAIRQMIKAKAPEVFAAHGGRRKTHKGHTKTTASAAVMERPKAAATPLFTGKGGVEPRALKAVPKAASPAKPIPAAPVAAPASKGTAMRTQIETIGPKEAEALLKSNTLNRPISETTVRRYVQDMLAGAWQENAATIVISRSNRLLDGQHRLHAILRSGVSLRMLISYDVDDAAFHTIDNGKTRSASDILSIGGLENTKTLGVAGKLILNYASGTSLHNQVGRVALVEFIEANPQVAAVVDTVVKHKIRFSKGVLAAVLALGDSKGLHGDKVEEFLEAVETGAGLEKGDPRLTLREWESLERIRSRNQLRQPFAFGAAARAWNAFVAGKSLTTIRGINTPTLSSLPILGYVPGSIVLPRAGLNMPDPKVTPSERLSTMQREADGKFMPRDATVVDLGASKVAANA